MKINGRFVHGFEDGALGFGFNAFSNGRFPLGGVRDGMCFGKCELPVAIRYQIESYLRRYLLGCRPI